MRRIAPLALLVAIVAAGCGNDSEETTTTKADYVEIADAICSNHRSRREDLESQARELGSIDSAADSHRVADLLRGESANRTAEVDELRDLDAPAGDVSGLRSFLSHLSEEVPALDELAQAYEDRDPAEIRKRQIRLGATAAETGDAADAYGFAVCGQG